MLEKYRLVEFGEVSSLVDVGEPFQLRPVNGGFLIELWKPYTGCEFEEFIEADDRKDDLLTEKEQELINLALSLATECHKGQKGKDGNNHINHPIPVTNKFTCNSDRAIVAQHYKNAIVCLITSPYRLFILYSL